jgi:CDP-glycerol glycerophosphotransferase
MAPMPRLSVIVPIYAVEPFLGDCLDSLAAQDVSDFEAILIDDGSPDRSGELAERYAARDPRLRVVHQANAGLGAARNAGVALARGEFLAFLDADDMVPRDGYARLLAVLERTGSDFE